MAIDYLLDQNGDLALDNNRVVLTSTIEQSSKQQCIISLNTFRGEWLFNILAGIPWLKNDNNDIQVLGKSTKRLIDAVIQQNILDRENIVKIVKYSSDLDKQTRVCNISFEAETTQGSTIEVNTSSLF